MDKWWGTLTIFFFFNNERYIFCRKIKRQNSWFLKDFYINESLMVRIM